MCTDATATDFKLSALLGYERFCISFEGCVGCLATVFAEKKEIQNIILQVHKELVDLRGAQRTPPPRPNSIHFHAFSAKIQPNNRFLDQTQWLGPSP